MRSRNVPNVTVEGGGKSDADGRVTIMVPVGIDGEGELPTMMIEGKEVEFAYALVEVTAPGFRTAHQAFKVYDGAIPARAVGMHRLTMVTSKVLTPDRKPVANLKMAIAWQLDYSTESSRYCMPLGLLAYAAKTAAS